MAQLPQFIVDQHLSEGRLLRLLRPCEPEPKPAWLVVPAARSVPRRVRAVIEHLEDRASVLPGTRAGARGR